MVRFGARPFQLAWLLLPVTVGPQFGAGLADTAVSFRTNLSVVLWLGWAVGLAVSLVPLPVALTITRVMTPVVLLVVVASSTQTEADATALVAAVFAAVVLVLALLPSTGAPYIDGASYGEERRFALRPPAVLVLGPIPLAWLILVSGALAGPLLLADGRVAPGLGALAVGWPTAALLGRSLHSLSTRWLVFVPTGFVVHDHLALADPVLFPRRAIVSFGPAPADSTATDLSAGAYGLGLEAVFDPAIDAVLARTNKAIALDALLVMPTLPDAVLTEVASRGIG